MKNHSDEKLLLNFSFDNIEKYIKNKLLSIFIWILL